MAVGPHGEIAVVWMEFKGDEFGTGRWRVRLAVRRAVGGFDRSRIVAAGKAAGDRNSYSVAVAFGARRDIVVAYSRERGRRTIAVRTLRRGRRFDRPQVLGPDAGLVTLAVGASRAGRAVVAWAPRTVARRRTSPPWCGRRSAARARRGSGRARLLNAGEANLQRAPGRLRLAVAPNGTAAVAWSNALGRFATTYPVRVAVVEAGKEFGPVNQLATNGAAGDVAVRTGGEVLVAWTGLQPASPGGAPPAQASAALRPAAGQPFAPSELVSARAASGRTAAAAFDPRTGRPTVVWPAPLGGPPDPLSSAPEVLDIATRTG